MLCASCHLESSGHVTLRTQYTTHAPLTWFPCATTDETVFKNRAVLQFLDPVTRFYTNVMASLANCLGLG